MQDPSRDRRPGIGRRGFLQSATGAVLAAAAGLVHAQSAAQHGATGQPAMPGMSGGAMPPMPAPPARKLKIAMLVYPQMVALDLVGPQTVLNLMRPEMHLVWKDLEPVSTEVGFGIKPTTAFADCPKDLDILFVPGGLDGTVAVMDDRQVLDFLADRGSRAHWVTSVCTGALVLGAAGLLDGYKATSHWYCRDMLPLLGATPVAERVVVDRNRMTGAGVTAGIDFGLTLAAMYRGDEIARHYQLAIEYDPHPPFNAGTPATAGEMAVKHIMMGRGPLLDQARAKAERIGATFAH